MLKTELKIKLLPDEIFALTIYGEARGEPVEGQIAVANVVMNRLKFNPSKYKTPSDVCLEPLQFSCWNNEDNNLIKLLELAELIYTNKYNLGMIYRQCHYIATGVIGALLLDNTDSARYYMESSLFNNNRPSWAKISTKVKVIGHHTFFSIVT